MTILRDEGDCIALRCHQCDKIFWAQAYGVNVAWNYAGKYYVAQCNSCGEILSNMNDKGSW